MLNLSFTVNTDIHAFVEWFVGDRNKSQRTGVEYARDIARFARFICPKLLNDATVEQIDDWMRVLRRDNQPQSVRRKVAALSCYFTWLKKKRKHRIDNPAKDVDLPKVAKSLPKSMSEADVEKLLNVTVTHRRHSALLTARNAAMFEMMYGSGVRRFEVCGLDVEDIDFTERQIRVRHGKGNKERYTFLSGPSIAKLEDYLIQRRSYAVEGESALFVTISGRRITPRQLWAVFNRAREAAGLKNVVPHTMRHAFATHSYRHGMGLRELQVLLGHESIATTQRYTKVTLEHAREAYERSHPRALATARAE